MNDNFNDIVWPGWRTVRALGHGSFGTVYEIHRYSEHTVEKAALKVISIPQHSSDLDELFSDGQSMESVTKIIQGHVESVVAEYNMMRQMNECVNVVSCDDVRYVQHDDRIGWDIYIKMELLTPLTQALSLETQERTVLKIAKDLCNALVVCRQNNIVHRDIKPQNIFVSQYGDYKLGDFGVAKTMEKTTGGTKIGTYKYMAPEVYNNQPYSSTADIYSLGLVLYWLLNERRLPFLPLPPAMIGVGMDEDARLRRLKGEKFPKPAHGSEGLKAIVMKACEYNPKKRYQSASEMLEALNRLDGKKSGAANWHVSKEDDLGTPKETGAVRTPDTDDPLENDSTLYEEKGTHESKKAKKKKKIENIIYFLVFLYIYVKVTPYAIKDFPVYIVIPFLFVHVLIILYRKKFIDILLKKSPSKSLFKILYRILLLSIGLAMIVLDLIPLIYFMMI